MVAPRECRGWMSLEPKYVRFGQTMRTSGVLTPSFDARLKASSIDNRLPANRLTCHLLPYGLPRNQG